MASERTIANVITPAMLELYDSTTSDDMKTYVTQTLKSRFQSNKEVHVKRLDGQFLWLDRWEVDDLEVPFSEEDVKNVLMGVDRNKALGQMGSHLNSFNHFGRPLKMM